MLWVSVGAVSLSVSDVWVSQWCGCLSMLCMSVSGKGVSQSYGCQ